MFDIRILVAPVSGDIDREDLERIEGETFECMDDVMKALDYKQDFEHYTLSDFMDLSNDSDSQTTKIDDWVTINIDECWIGYINLNK